MDNYLSIFASLISVHINYKNSSSFLIFLAHLKYRPQYYNVLARKADLHGDQDEKIQYFDRASSKCHFCGNTVDLLYMLFGPIVNRISRKFKS
jgi:hypothetical protein